MSHLILDPPLDAADAALYAKATLGATLIESHPEGHEVWSVPHRAWATFPPGIRSVSDEATALGLTAGLIADASPCAVVEAPAPLPAAPGRVLSIQRGLESLRIEAEAEGDATLVINDAWWPGWKAHLDGRVVPIYRADGLVRAVRWPAGRHVLEMVYDPLELRLGLALTEIGFIALAALAARAHLARGGRRVAPPPGPDEPAPP